MINYQKFFEKIGSTRLKSWLDRLPSQIENNLYHSGHGDIDSWLNTLKNLPKIKPSIISLDSDTIQIGSSYDTDLKSREKIEKLLFKFHPWRKGPFSIFGINIDTEWRSDIKWNRLKNKISPLKNRTVLDVGCGSGYHVLRMAASGARLAIGIDPMLLYVMQFQALQFYINNPAANVLPLSIDELPEKFGVFDTVFSMGVLYHRRSPLDHLFQLKALLKKKGELILETLVIDGKEGEVLVPGGRYAKMRNVWFIPSCLTLESWMKRAGFGQIRLIDVTQTTSEEQRVTSWMGFESLDDFLDPKNPKLTVEGYPRPKRAIFIANA